MNMKGKIITRGEIKFLEIWLRLTRLCWRGSWRLHSPWFIICSLDEEQFWSAFHRYSTSITPRMHSSLVGEIFLNLSACRQESDGGGILLLDCDDFWKTEKRSKSAASPRLGTRRICSGFICSDRLVWLNNWRKSKEQHFSQWKRCFFALLLTDFHKRLIYQLAPLALALSYCWSDWLKWAGDCSFNNLPSIFESLCPFQTVGSRACPDGWV